MLIKLVEVEVDISTDQFVHEIQSRGPLDLIWIFKALSETTSVEDWAEVRGFVGSDTFEKFAKLTSDFAQRIQDATEEEGDRE